MDTTEPHRELGRGPSLEAPLALQHTLMSRSNSGTAEETCSYRDSGSPSETENVGASLRL